MIVPVVVQRPNFFSFSKNQLLWKVWVSYPSEEGCQLEVRISANDPDLPVLDPPSFTVRVKPDADGYCNVYLQDVVDSMLTNEMPDLAGLQIQPATNYKAIYFEHRRISTAYPTTDWENDGYIIVIKGGIENLKYDYNNYFKNYQAVNLSFATWKPNNSFIRLNDRFWISILFQSESIPAWRVRVRVYWTDGSSDIIDIDADITVLGKLFYHIMAGPEDLGIIGAAAGRTLYKYSLQVVEQDDTDVTHSEVYTFYADYRAFYNVTTFVYFNSLGGIDHARILGEKEDSYQRSFIEAEKFTGSLVIGEPADTQYVQTGITRMLSYKGDAGLQYTKAQLLALQELHVSELITEIVGDKYRRLWITSKSEKLLRKTDKKWSFPIEWRYGFVEEVFTPPGLELGEGDDVNEYESISCPVPTDLLSEAEGDTVVFSWVEVVGATYDLEYKLDGGGSWTVVNPATSPKTLSLDPGTYNWRVRAICTPSVHSAYVNGSNFTIS